MNAMWKRALRSLVIVGASGLALAGCAGTSPISPSTTSQTLGATATPLLPINGSRLPIGEASTLAQGQGAENRFVLCYESDGSPHQLSVHAMGMAGAVHHCLKVLHGRVAGVIRPEIPEIP